MLAKLTPPGADAVVPRPRLYHTLDAMLSQAVVWIDAPAGYGKTMLAAGYAAARQLPCVWYRLDAGDDDPAAFLLVLARAIAPNPPDWRLPPGSLAGLSTFARRCFEELGERLSRPALLVLDNVEDLAPDSPLHEVLAAGFSSLPAGVRVLVLGRNSAPPPFARLRANGKLYEINVSALRLSRAETEELVRSRGRRGALEVSAECVEELHARCHGWAAGLMLLLGHHALGSTVLPEKHVFDYFAAELLDRVDEALERFLLCTAFLPQMTAPLAGRLQAWLERSDDQLAVTTRSATAIAEQQLETLTRTNYFTERGPGEPTVYSYHPLFRQFLRQRARQAWSIRRQQATARAAATVLADEDLSAAATLLVEQSCWPELLELVGSRASELLGNGLNASLIAWIGAAPRRNVEGDLRALRTLGLALLPFDPARARGELERAFELAPGAAEAERWQLWAAIVESFLIERSTMSGLDRWLGYWRDHAAELDRAPAPLLGRILPLLFGALTHRQPDAPQLAPLAEQVGALLRQIPDASARAMMGGHLANYYHWLGEVAHARHVTEGVTSAVAAAKGELAPLGRLHHHVILAIQAWFDQQGALALGEVEVGLRLAEQTGLHLLDDVLIAQGVYASLTLGDVETARAYLQRLTPVLSSDRSLEQAHYDLLASYVDLAAGDPVPAVVHAEAALRAGVRAGTPFPQAMAQVALARARGQLDDRDQAEVLLERAARTARAMHSRLLLFDVELTRTQLALRSGSPAAARAPLVRAFAIARQADLTVPPWWRREERVALYGWALEHGVEAGYVRAAVRRGRLPLIGDAVPSVWPHPVVARLLGGFELEVDGEDVLATARASRRPLDLFKCLVALGGSDVPGGAVTDALWPEADGDKAAAALKTTLARLRKLVGRDAIRLRRGRLSIDETCCYVDALVLERALQGNGSRLPREHLAALYRGPFLPREDVPWVLGYRERLQVRYQRVIQSSENAG